MNKLISILLTLSILFYSLGQVGRLWIPDQPIYFYMYELLLIPLLGVLVWNYRRAPFDPIRMTLPILLFLGWICTSFVISLFSYAASDNIIGLLYLVRLVTYLVLAIYLPHHMSFRHKGNLYEGLIRGVTLWVIITSVIQYLLYPNFGNLAYLGWDPHVYRVVGLFFDPPITISVFVLLLLYQFFTKRASTSIGYITMSLALIGLAFLTYSRGGLMALMGTLLLYVIWTRRIQLLVVGVGVVLIGFLLLPKGQTESINLFRTTSIASRIADYKQGFEIWQKAPIRGIGYNHIRPEKSAYITETFVEDYNPSHAGSSFHSSFLIILVTTGVIGYILYLYLLFAFARLSPFALFSIVYLCIISLFDNVLLHPFILFLFFVLISFEKQVQMRGWQWVPLRKLYL